MVYLDILMLSGIAVLGLLVLGFIFARLYTRASKEQSFVRTGFGGEKVIMNGGALVLPVLHQVIPVNMNTLRLEVSRARQEALITKDRMRVDVKAEFYVRVQPSVESIANAAQTLGRRTLNPQELSELIEGKFVDALRSVAAGMEMKELHEQRADFVQKVQQVVSEDLLKNGLELETVSLTSLDQTAKEFFNPDNAFDAEGLTRLTQEIEQRRKLRNDIERETQVQIEQKNLDAQKQQLLIAKEGEFVRLDQQQEISVRTATQKAQVAKEEAERFRESEEAKIVANQSIETARIQYERTVEQQKVEKERGIAATQVEKEKAISLAEQDRDIAVSNKSKEQSEAKELADQARAKAVTAEEQVATAREVEKADRAKKIEIVDAEKEAEKQAIGIRVSAKAEKEAAQDKAEAVRIEAAGKGEAIKIEAEATARKYEVEAAGQLALNQAANILSDQQVNLRTKLELISNLAEIIRESVKPMERIDGIKIIQVDGLNGAGSAAAAGAVNGGGGNLADAVVSAGLKYRAQAPLVDALLSEIGLSGSDLGRLSEGAAGAISKSTNSSTTPAKVPSPDKSKGT